MCDYSKGRHLEERCNGKINVFLCDACLVLSIMPSTKFNKFFISFQELFCFNWCGLCEGFLFSLLDMMGKKSQVSRWPSCIQDPVEKRRKHFQTMVCLTITCFDYLSVFHF